MPNQNDICYSEFKFKVEDGFLVIKQGDSPAYNLSRTYRMRIRSILNCYIEGPFGGYDEVGAPRDDQWRLVIQGMRLTDGPTQRDLVIYIQGQDQAEEVLKRLTERLDF